MTGVCGWWHGTAELVRSLGIAYLAGIASFGVIAQLLYVCGGSLSRPQVIVISLALACGALRGVRGESAPAPPKDRWRFLGVPVALVLVLIAVDLWYQPLWAYDSWTFWTPKAHALWALGGLNASWFTQANLTSPDYPILLPAVEAAGFRFTGYETGLLDVQSLFFVVAFLHALYRVALGRSRSVVVWAVLAMVVVAPSLTDQLAAAEGDIPVSVLFATAGACGAVWLRDRNRPALFVAGVLAAGACATKVEGLVCAIAVFVGLAVAAGRRGALPPLAVGAASVVAGVVPWRIWLAIHHVANQGSVGRITGIGYLAQHVSRIPLAVAYMVVKMLDPRAWLLLVPLFVFVLVRAWRHGDRLIARYAIVTVAIAFSGLVLAYWSTRLGLHYQLTTSARRVVTGLVFFGAALTPLLSERS